MTREELLLIVGVVLLPIVNFYGVRMWLGITNRDLMLFSSRSWMFWAEGGRGGLLVLAWLALGLDLLAIALGLASIGLLPAGQVVAWISAVPFALWMILTLSGHPHWALPPWFRHAVRDPRLGAGRAHVVAVNYVAEAQRGTAPYFVALCSCGNVGAVVQVVDDLTAARRASFADARRHSEHVEERISAPLDPMPR
jgi:hypothetical protein